MLQEKTNDLVERAAALFSEASYLTRIETPDEYEQALNLLNELTDSFEERNQPLIDLLFNSIEGWESEDPDVQAFDARIDELDPGVSTLKVLIDQHQLKLSDFKDELGGKSHVSMILSGARQLTKDHIQALSQRFGISPALFF